MLFRAGSTHAWAEHGSYCAFSELREAAGPDALAVPGPVVMGETIKTPGADSGQPTMAALQGLFDDGVVPGDSALIGEWRVTALWRRRDDQEPEFEPGEGPRFIFTAKETGLAVSMTDSGTPPTRARAAYGKFSFVDSTGEPPLKDVTITKYECRLVEDASLLCKSTKTAEWQSGYPGYYVISEIMNLVRVKKRSRRNK